MNIILNYFDIDKSYRQRQRNHVINYALVLLWSEFNVSILYGIFYLCIDDNHTKSLTDNKLNVCFKRKFFNILDNVYIILDDKNKGFFFGIWPIQCGIQHFKVLRL